MKIDFLPETDSRRRAKSRIITGAGFSGHVADRKQKNTTAAGLAEMPQNATESTTAAECTTEAEKTAETPETAPTECAQTAETITSGTGCAKHADSTTARRAARIDRRAHHKPHTAPKAPRCYISTIDGAKALNGAKYAPHGASHGKPVNNRFVKSGIPRARNGTFETSAKICGHFEKIRVGFHIGLSPPGGYQKILQ